MIYKSYIAEQSLEKINKKLFLFYGENFGLKKQFREQIKKENKNAEFIYFTQDEILKNEHNLERDYEYITVSKRKSFFNKQLKRQVVKLFKFHRNPSNR